MRLVTNLHDVLDGQEAWRVEAEIAGNDGGEVHSEGFKAAVDFASEFHTFRGCIDFELIQRVSACSLGHV